MIYFAKLVSIVFHPAVLILLLPFLVVYRQTESGLYASKWMLFSSPFVFLAGFLVILGERFGIFSDNDLTKRRERGKFYAAAVALLVLYTGIIIFLKGVFSPFAIIALGALFGVLIFSVLNHFFKISMHSGTACAFVISIGILYGINVFFAIIWIAPIMIWARIALGKHTLTEAISGGTLGGIITFFTYLAGRTML